MWQIRQLEKLLEIEPKLVDGAIDRLLKEDPLLREKLVLGAYLDGDINFGKAAELLGLHPVELRQRFLKRGIPIRIGSESIEALQAEVAAADQIGQSR
jgi:predicted HTH domain antitoxin